MKKIILFFAAIFIANQLISQTISNVNRIVVMYDNSTFFEKDSIRQFDDVVKTGKILDSISTFVVKSFDIKNMKVIYMNSDKRVVHKDISVFETLNDGTFHIVCDERDMSYPEEDNVRILTHEYINLETSLNVYSWFWDSYNVTVSQIATCPKIIVE